MSDHQDHGIDYDPHHGHIGHSISEPCTPGCPRREAPLPGPQLRLLGYPARVYVEIDLPYCQVRVPVEHAHLIDRGFDAEVPGARYYDFQMRGDIGPIYDAVRAGHRMKPR